MSHLRVSLFGKFCVQYDEEPLDGLEARRVQELFCYLLLYRQRPHPREALAELLWGENCTANSRKYLRQALWQLQAALEKHIDTAQYTALLVDAEWVQWNPLANLWLDVALFEEVSSQVRGVPGQMLTPETAHSVQLAVQLYKGALLDGWYQDWCLFERERFQNMYLAMLDKLMGFHEARQEYEAGLYYGMRILQHDRARERTHRRLMRLFYLAGDRTAALRQYEHCVEALNTELGVGPARQTIALYRQICLDQLDLSSSEAGGSLTFSLDESASLPEILDSLYKLQSLLLHVHEKIQQEIRIIESLSKGQR